MQYLGWIYLYPVESTACFHAIMIAVELTYKVQDVLKEHEAKLKQEKLNQLSQSLLDCINELMHKEIYRKVVIEPESFAVTLYDKEGRSIPK
jgi:DNA sulfur modification protein DndD